MPEYALTTGTPAEFDPPKNRRTNRRAVKETEKDKEQRMSIYVGDTGGGKFTPHPDGPFPGICCDVVDLGWEVSDWGPKYKIRVVFFCGQYLEKTVDGEQKRIPMLVSQKFTGSLSEKANLLKFLQAWRGKPFTPEQRKKFDMENMIAAPALLQVVHNEARNGNVYANIDSVMRLPAGMEAPPMPDDYVRVCDRPDWTGPAPHPEMDMPQPEDESQAPPEEDDDGLPF